MVLETDKILLHNVAVKATSRTKLMQTQCLKDFQEVSYMSHEAP
jgi:hypothetical protein